MLYENLLRINQRPDSRQKSPRSGLPSKQRVSSKPTSSSPREYSYPHCSITVVLPEGKLRLRLDFNLSEETTSSILDRLRQEFALKDEREVVGFTIKPCNIKLDYLLVQPGLAPTFLQNKNLTAEPFFADPPRKKISILNFKIINCIGTGGFAKVFLVRSRVDGQFYAMKLI